MSPKEFCTTIDNYDNLWRAVRDGELADEVQAGCVTEVGVAPDGVICILTRYESIADFLEAWTDDYIETWADECGVSLNDLNALFASNRSGGWFAVMHESGAFLLKASGR